MNLSEILIGPNMKAHPDCLGIYIGIDELYVAQSARRDSGVVLESLIRVPVNLLDKSQLKPLDLNESFFTMEYWQDALTRVTSKKSWDTTQVVVSLAPEFCLLRHFVISIPLKRQEWKEGIPNEARKYIHFPFDKAVYSYYAYEFETAATKQKKLGVVFAMTSKTTVSHLEKGLKAVGLDLISVEPSAVSLGRTFTDNDKEAVGSGRIYSFFGKEMANFIFMNGTVPMLERDVEISGSIPAERRRFEIANSAEFIAKQLERDPFEEAVVIGYNSDQWTAALEADSHKPVRRWDLSEVFGIETKSSGEVAAIGASGKFFDTKVPDIDFNKGKRLSAYEFTASWTAWKIVMVLVVLMLLYTGKSYMELVMANYSFKQKKAVEEQVIEDFKGLSATQLQTNLDNLKNQNEVLTDVYLNSPLITPILTSVAQAMLPKMWLTKINFSSTFPPRRQGEGRLVLEGILASGKESTEDLLLGGQFKESVAKQPALKRLCRNIKMSYATPSVSTGRNAKKKEGTEFVLSCENESRGRGR